MKKTILIIVAAVLCVVMIPVAFYGCMGLGALGLFAAAEKNEEITDVSRYAEVIGKNAAGDYAMKSDVDESLFPASAEGLCVKDFRMVYKNAVDPEYFAYLAVEYGAEDYAKECERLGRIGVGDYVGKYGMTGFDKYELLSMTVADEGEQSIIYALGNGKSEIVYVEMIFHDYFMIIVPSEHADASYLPAGLDVSGEGEYRKGILGTD